MAREIRFRAWDSYNKKMVYSGFYIEQFSGNCYWAWEDVEPFDRHGIESCEPQPILLQFTGLKDKNGKEIYEGDILEIIASDGSKIRKLLKWNDGKAAFNICNISEMKFEKNWDIWGQIGKKYLSDFSFYIIGNKFENSELITHTDEQRVKI